jgi:NAD+ synthase
MKNYEFNAQEVADKLVLWLRDYFNNNGNPLNAVIGISGGKDSTVVAAALVKAVGADRVYGVLMPNGTQVDIDDSYKVCEFLGLKPYLCNIAEGYNGIIDSVSGEFEISKQAAINLAPMVRMSTLKAISQCVNGRFTCNGNLSELYIGWFTLGGDDQGNLRPLANLTATEVSLVGKALGLPDWAVFKKPTDGLWGVTDEEKFGFSYAMLDRYIRTGECDDIAIKAKIDAMHDRNAFKLKPMPEFNPFAASE